MGAMIPRAVFTKRGYHMESDTANAIDDWERRRRCLGMNPDLFDVDAPKEFHEEAKSLGCDNCEVISECRRDRMLNRPVDAGIYAGMVFTNNRGEAPYSIDGYHESHKIGGGFRRADQPKYPPGWTETRKCAGAEIGCDQEFTVTPQNHGKKFHNTACRRRFYQVFGSELADAV